MINTPSNRLPVLQADVTAFHREAEGHLQSFAEKALACGAALIEAKGLVSHGGWADWLATAGIPERSAQRYMRLHLAGFNSATVADLGLNHAEKIAGLADKLWPTDDRGKVVSGIGIGGAFWAVIIRHHESAFYAAVRYTLGDDSGGEAVTLFKPLPQLFLAQTHFTEMRGIQIETIHDMPADEAEAWLPAVGAKMVRHSWGTRLEAA